MSCNDIASILDTHRPARLTPAERAHVDAHLAACTECAAAWAAQTELLALRVPPVPATLLERALLASRSPRSAEPRRTRLGVVVGSALLAGAALASVTIMTLTTSPSPPSESPAADESGASETAPADKALDPLETTRSTPGDRITSVELVETALSIAPIVRWPPDYPPEALKRRLEGYVQLEFDVTAAGVVENISVVESSDAMFEEPAVRALSKWRYLPRIVAGKRVAAKDIRTNIRWAAPNDEDPPPDQRQVDAKQEAAIRGLAAFSGDLEVALDRLAADDLRGAELQLDQMLAVYPAAGYFHGDIWSFFGYLFTVQGNYDRAIYAYETGLADYARNGAPPTMGPWVELANLYFARHQYDLALKALLRPIPPDAGPIPAGKLVLKSEAMALLQKLQALGVTEETLQ
jgi:TonB family protein